MGRRLVRAAGSLLATVLLAFAVLLGLLRREHGTELTLPAPTGPFAVGRATRAWVDAPPFGPPGAPRDLVTQRVVWVWYPAAPAAGSPASEYLPASWRAALRQRQGRVMGILTRDPDRVRAHSTADPPVSAAEPAYPVLILRPGLGALTTDFTTLAEDLASHGYVVAGFDAPYRTSLVVVPDGRVALRRPEDNPETLPGPEAERLAERLQREWCRDVAFIVDRLDELNRRDPSGRFQGRLDLRRLGVLGHSLGGAVAAQFCHDDARCKAGIDMDGALRGSVVREGVGHPFMFLLSDRGAPSDPVDRRILGDIRSVHDRLPPESRAWITLRGAHHFSFSDQALLKSRLLTRLFGRLEPRRGLALTAESVRWFFDAHLKASPGPPPSRPELEIGPR